MTVVLAGEGIVPCITGLTTPKGENMNKGNMKIDIQSLIDDCGGPAKVAEITGVQRTAPYGWIRRGYIASTALEKIKEVRPDIDLDTYFKEA